MIISVIIPVYNSENTIHRCISSVISSVEQVLDDYEVLCIDDGSTDNSLSILNEIANKNQKIKVFTQKNSGAATARNLGLDNAKGDLIFFNDSDDEWTDDHVLFFLDIMKKYPEIDCISGNHDKDYQKPIFLKKFDDNLYKASIKSQLFKNYFSPPNVVMRRSIVEANLRFKDKMRYMEDAFFFNEIAYCFNSYFINRKTAQSIRGKKRYGDSGLSGNLIGMEKGELFNLKYAFSYFKIGIPLFLIAMLFSILKFIRRCCFVFLWKIRRGKHE